VGVTPFVTQRLRECGGCGLDLIPSTGTAFARVFGIIAPSLITGPPLVRRLELDVSATDQSGCDLWLPSRCSGRGSCVHSWNSIFTSYPLGVTRSPCRRSLSVIRPSIPWIEAVGPLEHSADV